MRVIGLMSGTSMDGVDGVILDTDGESVMTCLETASLEYDKDFVLALKKMEVDHIDPAIVQQSTEYHAKVIEKLMSSYKGSIDLIGYHGQTIYHNPREKRTVQIGYPEILAKKFGIPVIYDFRTQDMLHGGQGAPLAPLYHHARMMQKKLEKLMVLNCGGIANITVMTREKILAGFDTGPGNVLIDQFVRSWTNQEKLMDYNGAFALQGKINPAFFDILLNKTISCVADYYHQKPPKSLDSRDILFIPEIMENYNTSRLQNLYDGCAVLAGFTGVSILENLKRLQDEFDYREFSDWVIVGGGAKNPAIVNYLASLLPKGATLHTAEEMGWSSHYMEAELIAWLAVRSVKQLPLTLPETTGVSKPMTGGKRVLVKRS